MRGKAMIAILVGWLAISLFSVTSSFAAELLDAVKEGDREAVESLLRQNADVNVSQPDGATALAWAVHRDDLEVADLLIGAGADLNAANDYGVTPLSLACSNRNTAMVQKLASAGADPNVPQWTGETPFMTCARTGLVDAVKFLLTHGADVNMSENRRGQTALMWAIAEGYPDVARVLIEHGADIHAKSHMLSGLTPKAFLTYYGELQVSSSGGFTPLLFAAQQGDIETASLLLEKGADVNYSAPDEGSALLLASSYGHEDLALFFLENGADPMITAGDGSAITSLHYALRDGIKELMASKGAGLFTQIVQQEQQSATERMQEAGPLPGASMPRLAKALIESGADVNAPLKNAPLRLREGGRSYVSIVGATPFLLAAASSDVRAMTLLLEVGANPRVTTVVDEKENPSGVYSDEAQLQGSATPLLAAAGLGRTRARRGAVLEKGLNTVKTLLNMGFDVNEANDLGWTPVHAAVYAGENEMVQLLVDNGAKLDVQNGCGQTPLSIADASSARGLVQIPRARPSTEELLRKLGAGATVPPGPVGRCIEGRYGIEYFVERDKDQEGTD